MKFVANIEGLLEHATAEAEAAIHKAFEDFCSVLKLNNVTHDGTLSTPTIGGNTSSFTAVPAAAPGEAAPAAETAPAAEPAATETPASDTPAAEGGDEAPAAETGTDSGIVS